MTSKQSPLWSVSVAIYLLEIKKVVSGEIFSKELT